MSWALFAFPSCVFGLLVGGVIEAWVYKRCRARLVSFDVLSRNISCFTSMDRTDSKPASTPNHEIQTLNPKLQTLNPKPQNHEIQTLNPKLQTLNPKPPKPKPQTLHPVPTEFGSHVAETEGLVPHRLPGDVRVVRAAQKVEEVRV